MKLMLSFKTPDVVDDALSEIDQETGRSMDMCEREEIEAAVEKFVEYGECLTVEIDTEQGTATVLPV